MEGTIVLVDDEKEILEIVSTYLQKEGFEVLVADRGEKGLELVERTSPDLVLLDWMLPEISGLEICKNLRSTSNIPIIMLTARSEEFDRVLGLECGADDYIVKPFSLLELVARIRTVLRRSRGGEREQTLIVRGDLSIDQLSRKVCKKEEELFLTPTEFKILCMLAARPGVTYSRLQLLKEAMGEEYVNYERSIDTHVFNLRKKIEDNPSEPVYVQTVFGIGYRFGEKV